ncbi:hypothetical protein [Methylobacterium durans]|uniref:hypothetical protein n=1 Tax=Methylobacterium durans TaxID=2202825 RepID=UPI0013A56B9C|nr:hypothetical protein [Methylobacterium durans]
MRAKPHRPGLSRFWGSGDEQLRTRGLGQRQWHVTANEASVAASARDWQRFDTRQDTPPDAFRV